MKILKTFIGIQYSSEWCLINPSVSFDISLQFLPTRGHQDIVCFQRTVDYEFRNKTFHVFLICPALLYE